MDPRTEEFEWRDLVTVVVDNSGVRMTNGNHEYSLMNVNEYLLCETDGSGPLRSLFNRSISRVVLISFLVLLL